LALPVQDELRRQALLGRLKRVLVAAIDEIDGKPTKPRPLPPPSDRARDFVRRAHSEFSEFIRDSRAKT
jgi:hypothetical protein